MKVEDLVFVKRCRCGNRISIDAATVETSCPVCKRHYLVEVKATLKEVKKC